MTKIYEEMPELRKRDATPTWSEIVPMLRTMVERAPTAKARDSAWSEIERMARLADKTVHDGGKAEMSADALREDRKAVMYAVFLARLQQSIRTEIGAIETEPPAPCRFRTWLTNVLFSVDGMLTRDWMAATKILSVRVIRGTYSYAVITLAHRQLDVRIPAGQKVSEALVDYANAKLEQARTAVDFARIAFDASAKVSKEEY